jgi:ribonuclease HI
MKIDIYADGSGQTANTDGGYGWVMVIDGVKISEGSGHCNKVSNNDMELEAAIQGLTSVLSFINSPVAYTGRLEFSDTSSAEVTLCSDSQIVLGWASGTYRFKQESKIEKYNQLKFYMDTLKAKTQWIRGHSGHEHQERCDRLANDARKGITTEKSLESNAITKIGRKKEGIVCFWAYGKLKLLDILNNVCEDYNREVHGKRGSVLEFREDKLR